MTWFLWAMLLFTLWRWHVTIAALNRTCDAFDALVKTHEALAKSHDGLCIAMECLLVGEETGEC